MKYNFDEIVPREGTDAIKIDRVKNECGTDDLLPMWVADMDFRTPPFVLNAIRKRMEQGILGYTCQNPPYYESICRWNKEQHGMDVTREMICYVPGVVSGIFLAVQALTEKGDSILIQEPVYHPFCFVPEACGRKVVQSSLRRTETSFAMDFERLREDIKGCRMMILCNPHNPAGRVWKAGELQRLNDICLKHGVRVVADEIHCELVMPGYEYTPFASISDSALDNSITCCSPSKSFNIAGLQMSNIICNDEATRQKIDRAININEICDVNPFGVEAVMAAYDECEDWIVQLNGYISDNYAALRQFFKAEMPQLKVSLLEGTYLVWVDIAPTGMTADALTDRLLSEGRVMVNRVLRGEPPLMRLASSRDGSIFSMARLMVMKA